MRPDMGGGAIALFLIAAVIVTVFYAVRGVIRYMKKREADRKEMIDLMRAQAEKVNRP